MLFGVAACQADAAEIHRLVGSHSTVAVDVHDKLTNGPLEASVSLDGPIKSTDYTDVSGSVRFYNLPSGTYRLYVTKHGYATATSDFFELTDDRSTSIRVVLARQTSLRTISVVRVRALTNPTLETIAKNDPTSLLSDTINDALQKIPGLQVSSDDSRIVGVSIDGHPANETSVNIDGIPLSVPGIADKLRYVDPDLLSGALVSFGGSASVGSLGFRTLEPTHDWNSRISTSYGSLQKSAISFAEQGTSGKFGFAFQHANRYLPNSGDGLVYEDSSGLTFTHNDSTSYTGDLAKIRYSSGPFSATALALSSESTIIPRCDEFVNRLPCSYGKGSVAGSSLGLLSISPQLTVGDSTVGASIFAINDNATFYQAALMVPDVPAYTDGSAGSLHGVSIHADIPSRKHLVSLQASNITSYSNEDAISSPLTYAIGRDGKSDDQHVHAIDYSITDRLKVSANLSATFHGSLSSLSKAGTAASTGAQILMQSDDQRFTVDINHLAIIDPFNLIDGTSGADALTYNCKSQVASGYSTGDNSTFAISDSLRLGWTKIEPFGQLTASGYLEGERNVSIQSLVSSSADPGLVTPDYLAAVERNFSIAGCPLNATESANSIYFSTLVSGLSVRYEGARLSSVINLTNQLTVQPIVSLTSAVLYSNDSRLINPLSLTVPGKQISGVPYLQAAVRATYRENRKGLEALINLRQDGRNGLSNLRPHGVVDMGVAKTFSSAKVLFVVNNLFDTSSGNFATTRNAEALERTGGFTTPGIAEPERPRQFNLTLSFGIGKSQYESSPTLVNSAGVSDESVEPLSYWFSSWPDAAPKNPFELNKRGACTQELETIAQPALLALKNYEALVSARSTPTSEEPDPLVSADYTVYYSRSAKTHTLTLRLTKLSLGLALSSCAHIFFGTPEQGATRGVVVPTQIYAAEQRFYFSPLVGIYVIPINPGHGFSQRYRTYAPSASRHEPFDIDEANCARDVRSAAARLLSELRSYFADPTKHIPTPSWTIEKREAHGREYYELRSDETVMLSSMFTCAHVTGITPKQLDDRRLGGASLPSFNYSDQLGIYVVSQ